MGEKVAVVLKRTHEHEGETRKPGDTISVYPDTANWLIAQDIAEKPLAVKSAVTGGKAGGSK